MAILDVVPVARKFEDRKPAKQPVSEYTSIDKGGRPITAAEEIIRQDREKFINPIFDPIKGAASRATRRVGDFFVPGTPFMEEYRKKERQKEA